MDRDDCIYIANLQYTLDERYLNDRDAVEYRPLRVVGQRVGSVRLGSIRKKKFWLAVNTEYIY